MNHMVNVRVVFIFLVIAVATSCSNGIHTSSWRAKGVDLKKFKSYAWLAPGDSALNTRRDDKLYAGTIQAVANESLKHKGMILKSDNPDAIFMFDTRLEDHMKYTQSPTLSVGVGYGGPGYYVGGMAPVAGGEITAEAYQKGMLIIEMYDVQTRELVWRGTAASALDYRSDIVAIIRKAVKDLFIYLPIHVKTQGP